MNQVSTTQTKLSKSSIGIEAIGGWLRLRLPRQVYGGRQKYLTLGLDDTLENREKARAKAWAIEEDIATGQFDPTLDKYRPQTYLKLVKVVDKPQKALTLIELWERYCEYRKPQVAETTFQIEYLKRYANHIKAAPSLRLEDAIKIRDYLVKTLSGNAAKRTLTQINACCKWAVKSNLISDNPFAGMAQEIKLLKEENEIDPFTATEREAIIEAFEQHPGFKHYAPYVKFLFYTGCRTGEAVALQWKHINSDCSQITFCESYSSRTKVRKDTKTHTSRKFPCNKKLQSFLLSIRPKNINTEELVFTNINGNPINPATFNHNAWKGEASKNKMGIVTQLVNEGKVERYRCQYNTRHTFITMAIEAGVSLAQVAKWVGTSPGIIMKYYAGTIRQVQVPEF